LAALNLLEGGAPANLDRLAASLRPLHLSPGQVLMREGEAGDTFALIVEGQVEATRTTDEGPQHLGQARAGSICGELAVLRGGPRTATITAVAPTLVAIGGGREFFDLLDDPVVLERMRHLASARLAQDLRPVATTLGDGTPILLRPLLPEDRGPFKAAVRGLSPDSRRRRFFSPGQPSPRIMEYLIDIDYFDHFAWVVLEDRPRPDGLATARYVRQDEDHEAAEMAFGVIDRVQGRGIGTFLLGAVGVAAGEAGIRCLIGHVLTDNAPMRAVFAKAGGITTFSDPGVVRIEVHPEAAAGLLEAGLRHQIRSAVHDIVTAASLALVHPG
jgi:CRP-like cAMP-binding protein/GNAT superfamily N-acetyltransferase